MWYAIHTEKGQEEAIRQQARKNVPEEFGHDFRVLYYVKKKRYLGQWHDERERFLPGYIFWVTDSEAEYAAVRLWPVRREEEEFLEKLTKGKDEVEMSYGVIRNGILEISDGALSGLESRVKKIDRHKRKGYISMRIHEEELMAEVGLEIREKT